MSQVFFWNSQFPGNQHFMLSQTISGHKYWNFLKHFGKIIKRTISKSYFPGGNVGGPSKPYISGKGGMSGPTPAEIGFLKPTLS